MELPPWVWALTLIVLAAVVVLDLTSAIRNPHRPGLREAATWSGVYIAAAFVFAGVMFWTQGSTYGGQFLAGFLTEKALSVDNLFVFLLIIQAFRVPEPLQSRVLLVGIVLSIALRSIFIALGSVLVERFSWVFLIFGAILIWTAVGLLRDKGDDEAYEPSRFMKFAESKMRVSKEYHGGKLLTRIDGLRYATPLLLAMLAIGSTDILFALDSIPAIFGLTQEPYLVWTATIFALFGLRQLYFLLAAMLKSLKFLALGLSAILGWIGVKLVMNGLAENQLPFINGGHHIEWLPHVPTALSLGVIVGVLAAVVIANGVLLHREGKTWKELFAESEAVLDEPSAPAVAVAEK
ncbi:TerC/Alx family metal homeostasis membrane protein [Glycomyces sp. TRM65418]|uniref:TerC/Alx family metal homeostasis membrane protein n=1 Tax=Glycomyces sp. TRM65418 TaxID=2867006 RepID=UPI001CE6139A|nr:TerC/Alx family metal homeostasis membrane protein [Glycomyces sp. TRM65418]MCC3761558.1 TerC/Alx family metal homeostasis membrane protein [Glycomyces sp. TRM65418]QZD55656.1 TerC/Alx family metal homeostasis membrane protein [Glycomyces sp. TRM65418]